MVRSAHPLPPQFSYSLKIPSHKVQAHTRASHKPAPTARGSPKPSHPRERYRQPGNDEYPSPQDS